MKKRPTQSDVAKLAGVTRSTVSVVLSGRTDTSIQVSEATRQRVQAAVKELGYAPDPVAQMLVQGQNEIIGVFTYESDFPSDQKNFFYQFLLGIESEASRQNFDILLFTRKRSSGARCIYPNGTNALRLADGAILFGSTPDREELKRLIEESYPFVYIGRRDVPGVDIACVVPDYRSASATATEHLIQLGHQRIGFVKSQQQMESSIDKYAGFEDAVQKHPEIQAVTLNTPDDKDQSHIVSAIAENHLTALVCLSDGVLFTIYAQLAEAGLRVPEDISLVALTEGFADPTHDYTPTHVHLDRGKIGAEAVRLLVAILSDESISPRQVMIDCSFIPGDTSAPPNSRRLPG